MAGKIRHRGPDWSGIYSDDHAILAHERLAIVDVEHGAQPLVDTLTGCVLAVNGEIYNHKQLRQDLKQASRLSDRVGLRGAAVSLRRAGAARLPQPPQRHLRLCPLRSPAAHLLIARDPIGVVPLYLGWDRFDHLYVASEMKALVRRCERILEFPPGHFYPGDQLDQGFQRYYEPRGQRRISFPTIHSMPPAARGP